MLIYHVICDHASGCENDIYVFDSPEDAKFKYNELFGQKRLVKTVGIYETSINNDKKVITIRLNDENGLKSQYR
jgi:hypothetical protein